MAWSVKELAEKRPDELTDPNAKESYYVGAKERDYEVLGTISNEHLEPFRESPGTLEERLWKRLRWDDAVEYACQNETYLRTPMTHWYHLSIFYYCKHKHNSSLTRKCASPYICIYF